MFKQLKTLLLSTSLLALGVLLLGVYYATRGRIVAAAVMITVACIYIIAVNLWFWHYVTDPIDALTRVRNKGGFDNYIKTVQDRLDQGEQIKLAIGVFDCDNLKTVNDQNGHDKGDIYLKNATQLICKTFQHSPVFRIGGDEFTVVLMGDDLQNRETLVREMTRKEEEISAAAKDRWEKVHVAMGFAEYDPVLDSSVNDTVRRADKDMYDNKRKWKKAH